MSDMPAKTYIYRCLDCQEEFTRNGLWAEKKLPCLLCRARGSDGRAKLVRRFIPDEHDGVVEVETYVDGTQIVLHPTFADKAR